MLLEKYSSWVPTLILLLHLEEERRLDPHYPPPHLYSCLYHRHFLCPILFPFPVSLLFALPSPLTLLHLFSVLLFESVSGLSPSLSAVRMLWTHIVCGWATPKRKGLLSPQVNHFSLLLSGSRWVPQSQTFVHEQQHSVLDVHVVKPNSYE